LPFEANSFDKVVALESAFHFQTRADFFREAFRVLRPGGRLVVLDIVPLPYDQLSFVPRKISDLGLHLWKTCEENVYDRSVYEAKMRDAGFDAKVESVFDDTLAPFARYTIEQLDTPEYKKKMSYWIAGMLWIPARIILDNPFGLVKLDYVLGAADKPALVQ
jgi:erythromycin 3''-O-methyltransferase